MATYRARVPLYLDVEVEVEDGPDIYDMDDLAEDRCLNIVYAAIRKARTVGLDLTAPDRIDPEED